MCYLAGSWKLQAGGAATAATRDGTGNGGSPSRCAESAGIPLTAALRQALLTMMVPHGLRPELDAEWRCCAKYRGCVQSVRSLNTDKTSCERRLPLDGSVLECFWLHLALAMQDGQPLSRWTPEDTGPSSFERLALQPLQRSWRHL